MRRFGRVVLALVLAASAVAAFAGGAGGVGFAGQYYHDSLSNEDLGLNSTTGFGYGSGHDGSRIGGFGTSFSSDSGRLTGGVGGLIAGHEWRTGPLTLALSLWGGIGGASWASRGYVVGYGAAQAELGVWVLPWMEIVGYVGYETLGNLSPGAPFQEAVLRTPMLGIRFAWGSQR